MPITDTTKAPPSTRNNSRSVSTTAKQSKREVREGALNGLAQLAQIPLMATKQFADAQTLETRFPAVATEVAKLADSNESIAKAIDSLSAVGPYTGLVMAVLPFVMQIAVNHGMMPAGVSGTVPADLLVSQAQQKQVQQQLDLARMQQEAQREAARINSEIQAFNDSVDTPEAAE